MKTETPRTDSAANESILKVYEESKQLERELFAARAEIEEIHETGGCSFKELNRVIEQRDRLAEALEECREDSIELLGERDWWQNEPRCNYKKKYQEIRDNVTRADKALAAVKGETR